ncbi:MAG: Cna B-type domain-containing protein [Lachnospiraceae bacterium]|nr:Cna B-type domain-containing protein [Lachnospiraceae bacterium]
MKEKKTVQKKKISEKVLALLVAFLCMATLLFSGRAAEAEEAGQNSIRLKSKQEGASFTLYKAADKQKDGTFVLTRDFAGAGTEVNDLTTDGLANAGAVLSAYIEKNHPQPVSTMKITDGTCQWTGLQDGLYIAVGSPIRESEKLLEFSPVVAYLPYTDNGTEMRDLDSEVKPPAVVPENTQYSVYKVWKDGTGSGRPDSVEVSLIQQDVSGSAVYDTRVLDKKNNWTYTWKNLPSGYAYKAIENKVPQGYTQTVNREGAKTIITNSRPSGKNPLTAVTSGKLPQTGQLWWPVPVLVAAGLLCLLVGFWKKTRNEKKTGERH